MFVSYGFGPWPPDESVRRTGVALGAYGRDFDVPALLVAEYDRAEAKCTHNGWHRQLKKLPAEPLDSWRTARCFKTVPGTQRKQLRLRLAGAQRRNFAVAACALAQGLLQPRRLERQLE